MAVSRICKCYICDKEELTIMAILPDNWIQEWVTSKIICNLCVENWKSKFKETPYHYIKGGEVIAL